MIHLVHLVYAIPILWLIRRDTALRDGISPALWIPTLWVGIISSRPATSWLGISGGNSSIEGSPVDALIYFTLIGISIVILSQRAILWGPLIKNNLPVLMFYLFLLVSVLWANSTFASFKRWFKEFGNILIILLILTEINPLQAIRAVFIRAAYFLIPLSVIYLRYFPSLGRRYSRSGGLEVIGVTDQKNTLGAMVLVCMLVLIWDWFSRIKSREKLPFLIRYLNPAMTILSFYVLHQSGSKTSLLCLITGTCILAAIHFKFLRDRINRFGVYTLGLAAIFFWADSYIGLVEIIVEALGRDMTFTGRTEVWRELLSVGTDPLYGTGFMSFWDDPNFQNKLPYWVSASAHNGYIEIFLAGGYLGLAMLGTMIFATAVRINRSLGQGGEFAVFRFAVLVVAMIANFSESNFACMTPIGLLFSLAAISHVPQRQPRSPTRNNTISHQTINAQKGDPPTPKQTSRYKRQ